MTLGEEAAARCADCLAARDAGWVDVSGWRVQNGERHNHLRNDRRTNTNRPVAARVTNAFEPTTDEPTTEEMHIATQMGITREQIIAQKKRDQEVMA